MNLFKQYRHPIIALIIFLAIRILLPAQNGLTEAGVSVMAVFITTIYLWVTVAVDWTSFLGIAGLSLTGAMTVTQLFQDSFGNYIIPLMISIMIFNQALEKVGVTQRFATWFITRKIVKDKPWVFITMFLSAVFIAALFMDLMPTVIIFMTMAESIFKDLGYSKDDKFCKVFMLGIMWISVVAYGSTPIAHAIPIMIMGMAETTLGYPISFFKYMSVGIPYALIFFLITILVFKFIIKPDVSKFVNYDLEKKKSEMQPMTTESKISAVVFVILIILWLFPDLGSFFGPTKAAASFVKDLGIAIPPLFGVSALCLIKVKGEPIINIGSSLKTVPWGSIIFAACILALGSSIGLESTGISIYLQNLLTPLATSLSPTMVVAVALLLALLLTNIMSCGVTAVLIYSTFVPVLMALPGNNVSIAGLAVLISLMADTAFVTPPANPSCPLVFGTQYITINDGLKYGSIMLAASYIIAMFAIWPLSNLVF